MNRDFIVYVDFDSTLYETKRFAEDLFHLIAAKAELPQKRVLADSRTFVLHPDLGGYDYAGHIARYGLDNMAMWTALEQLAGASDYLYPDAAPFIQSALQDGFEPKILSFGEERFQLAKILPTLTALSGDTSKKLAVTVVERKKHQHIRALHPGQKGVLIDDVPDQELPDGFSEIHLNRDLPLKSGTAKAGGYVVANLDQAGEVLRLG